MVGIDMNIIHTIAQVAYIPMSREDGYIEERFVFTEDTPIAIWVQISSEDEDSALLDTELHQHRVPHTEQIAPPIAHPAATIGIEKNRHHHRVLITAPILLLGIEHHLIPIEPVSTIIQHPIRGGQTIELHQVHIAAARTHRNREADTGRNRIQKVLAEI